MTEQWIGQLGYIGIAVMLILGGLGLPIPEEAPIIVAAVLSRNGQMGVTLAFLTCLAGVILGDFVVYGLGYFYGEKVLSFRATQRFLTRQREAQIKGYFQRHGFKILVSGRFVLGFRTAAYLTAGILKLPPLKLLLTDLVAATLSTSIVFGLGYAFAYHIQSKIQEAQRWLLVLAAATVCGWLFWRYYQARQRAGLPVGPPVLDSDDVPLPDEEFLEAARATTDPADPPSRETRALDPTAHVSDNPASVEQPPAAAPDRDLHDIDDHDRRIAAGSLTPEPINGPDRQPISQPSSSVVLDLDPTSSTAAID